MNKRIIILLCFILVDISFAQQTLQFPIDARYQIHHYTTDDGLSQVSINDIIQDDEGFLWLATQDGLNRFDGTSFLIFHHRNKSAKGLCGNFINVLLSDNQLIWIATRSGGLCYFDKKGHAFHHFKQLPKRDILDIEKDKSRNIYVTLEDRGIAVISNENKEKHTVEYIDYFKNKNVSVTEIFISQLNDIWVGTKQGRLFHGKITSNPVATFFEEITLPTKTGQIYVINSNSENNVWIGSSGNLLKINTSTKKIKNIEFTGANNINSPIVYDIQFRKGYLWLALEGGVYKYDINKSQIIKKYIHQKTNPKSLSNNTVNCLLFDNQNQLWVGTGKFLNLFYQNPVFYGIDKTDGNHESLNAEIVFSIYKEPKNLWIGTAGGGIDLIRNNHVYNFSKKTHHIPSNTCFSVLKDKNNLWVGTREGLIVLSNINKKYKKIKTQNILYNPKDSTSISGNFIRYIYKDNQQNIWLCTSNGGLNRFTGNLTENLIQFERYKHFNNNPNSIASNKVYYITQTNKSTYWIGTDKGLSILNFHNDTHTNPIFSQLKINNTVVLNNSVVYSILKDKDSSMWIGTNSGLYHYIPDEKILLYYNHEKGLPNDVIYGILQDFEDNIWVSTNKGISCFNKKTKTFTNYHQADGLNSEEYNLHAKFIDQDGILYFGGINGITYFDPKNLDKLQQERRLYIDNIQIAQPDNSAKKIYLSGANRVNIHHNQFPFYINFSDINLSYYKNTEFVYRLSSENEHWNSIQNKRQIQFLKLAPGDYNLEIQGMTRGKIWKNVEPLKLAITVLPVWWQSTWAYLFYSLLFLSVIYAFYRFSLNRKLEHQENLRLLELDELKTKLYGNITHELRTPLTVIMGVITTIKQKLSADELKKIEPKLKVLSGNSKKLLFLINQMLDLNKIESGKMKLEKIQADIIPFLKVNLDSFHSLSQHKNIELIYYDEDDEIIMDFDPDKVAIILSNLLSNAIKFTPEGGRIILHIKKNKDQEFLQIKIKDNGIGISEENQKHIFDRFYQVDRFAPGGTGIGLSLVKELVNLMNGTISVKSKLHQGTEFIIKIPITNEAKTTAEITIDIPLVEDPEYQKIDKIAAEQENAPLLLIVEDNKDVAQFIASCLHNQYEIIFAQDGLDGIQKALENIPDLIITDLMMPKADGFKVCQKLKNDEKTSHIPIIMLTARTMEKDKIKGFAHGADAYLTKPFNQNELRIRIEQLILNRKRLQEKYQKTGFYVTETTSKEAAFINKCIENIHNHLDDELFKSVQLAFAVNLSESQLYRKIKAITNLSTAVFIREVRLSAAKEILLKTDLNISEIAYKCGFSNPDWFSKSFKEKFGYNPSEYRQNN